MDANAIRSELLTWRWAMDRRRIALLQRLLSGTQVDTDAVRQTFAAAEGEPVRQAGVAVIPLMGVIRKRAGLMDLLFGTGGGLERFGAQLRAAVADEAVGAIVLHMDSPGGSDQGVMEAAALVRQARERKPVVALADGLMASAAYWIGSQAGEVVVTPSGEVGSIGVWTMHIDESELIKQLGLDLTLISAGKYKVEGNPFEPLGEEAQAFMQGQVDAVYKTFVADVAKGRGVTPAAVRDGYGEGRVLLAADAKVAGLVDRIGTLEETVGRLTGGSRGSRRRGVEQGGVEAPVQIDPEQLKLEERLPEDTPDAVHHGAGAPRDAVRDGAGAPPRVRHDRDLAEVLGAGVE